MALVLTQCKAKVLIQVTLEEIQAVVSGQKEALTTFVNEITPVVQARVARRLLQMSALSQGRSVRQDVEDFVQEVFVVLFENDAKVLSSWSPDKGLSLKNYVGLVAERHVSAALKTTKRSPWTESPTLGDKLENHIVSQGRTVSGTTRPSRESPEAAVEDRELFKLTLEELEKSLSPLGMQMFHAIIVKDKSVEEICSEFHMGADAVYAWRSRLTRRARDSFKKIMSERSASGARPVRVGND